MVVRGTYCSWLCAKRQVPLAGGYGGRPDRACAAPPPAALVTAAPVAPGNDGDGGAVAEAMGQGPAQAATPVVLPLPLVHRALPPPSPASSPTTQLN